MSIPPSQPIMRTPEPERSQIVNQSIVLIVIGALCGAVIPAILGIVALTQVDAAPESARTMLRWGWIVCIVVIVLVVLLIGAMFVLPMIVALLATQGVH